MVATNRIACRHLQMVDTQPLREQWIERLAAAVPRVEVTGWHKPAESVVRVFDGSGRERCVIDISSYLAR